MYGLTNYRKRENDLFRMFDDFEKSFLGTMKPSMSMRTDIKDEGDHYLLEAELPGFDKKDISIEVENGVMTISAQHSEEKEEKDDKGNYISRERRWGSFTRSFDVTGIDDGKISGEYKEGVLSLNLPKIEKLEPEKKKIELK